MLSDIKKKDDYLLIKLIIVAKCIFSLNKNDNNN